MTLTIQSTPLTTYLQTHLPQYLDLLQQMVRINSFTANAAGVNALGDLTAEIFAPLGFTAEFIPSVNPEYGRHLFLTRPGTSDQQIALITHLDTVFPPAEEIQNNFTWRVEGNRIYGPGTNDIKGGTVAIYMLLDALRQFHPQEFQRITWVVAANASEESMADDFGDLCRTRFSYPRTLAALVFEAGYQENHKFWLVQSRKGMGVFTVQVQGKSAHAGTSHDQGANAIVQLADVVQRLAALTDYQRNVTVNVGVIQGGTVTNRVPHYAEAGLEMRAFDQDVFAETLAAVLHLNQQATVRSVNGGYLCQVNIDLTRRTPPWPRNAGTDGLIRLWADAAATLGYRIVPENRGGLSDGNHIWNVVPTLDGLGVVGANAHCSERSADGRKDQEYCLPDSLVPKTVLNITAVLQLLTTVGE